MARVRVENTACFIPRLGHQVPQQEYVAVVVHRLVCERASEIPGARHEPQKKTKAYRRTGSSMTAGQAPAPKLQVIKEGRAEEDLFWIIVSQLRHPASC